MTDEKIDPAEVLEAVRDDSAGGIVLFFGSVRNRNLGRSVKGLEYEVYREMAEKKVAEIEDEVKRRWRLKHVRIVHREGKLRVGEISVAVAVSSQHRSEAFEACRFAIDELKRTLPVWKKEQTGSGKSWVEGAPIKR